VASPTKRKDSSWQLNCLPLHRQQPILPLGQPSGKSVVDASSRVDELCFRLLDADAGLDQEYFLFDGEDFARMFSRYLFI